MKVFILLRSAFVISERIIRGPCLILAPSLKYGGKLDISWIVPRVPLNSRFDSKGHLKVKQVEVDSVFTAPVIRHVDLCQKWFGLCDADITTGDSLSTDHDQAHY